MNILVLAAHPDDEVLGCGGTIARLAQEGHDVFVAILGEGITSRYERREEADNSLVTNLHRCSRQAAKILGVKDISIYDFPDNRFDTLPLLDIVKKVEDIVVEVAPKAIYTHHAGDLNVDHSLVARATLTATRPIPDCQVEDIYAFETLSSTEWAFQSIEPVFRPNTFVDIRDHIETKLAAMKRYESEVLPFPHPRSIEALRSNAMRWGSAVGLEFAEAFELIRSVRSINNS